MTKQKSVACIRGEINTFYVVCVRLLCVHLALLNYDDMQDIAEDEFSNYRMRSFSGLILDQKQNTLNSLDT